jgi:hypothetical protein
MHVLAVRETAKYAYNSRNSPAVVGELEDPTPPGKPDFCHPGVLLR